MSQGEVSRNSLLWSKLNFYAFGPLTSAAPFPLFLAFIVDIMSQVLETSSN